MKSEYKFIKIRQEFRFNGFFIVVTQQEFTNAENKEPMTITIKGGDAKLDGSAKDYIEAEFRKSDLWKHIKEI